MSKKRGIQLQKTQKTNDLQLKRDKEAQKVLTQADDSNKKRLKLLKKQEKSNTKSGKRF